MDLKTSIFKRKSGRHKGKWVLQISYFDATEGRNRVAATFFDKQSDAKDARPAKEAELRKTDGQIQTGSKMTFADLCEFAKQDFYRPAVIVQGRKVKGVKSNATASFLKTLSEYFGKKRLTQIRPNHLADYKIWRFERGDLRIKSTEATDRKEITHAAVNRELVVMRRLMKFAYGEGWISRDIFSGSTVIDRDAEQPRYRTLTDSEEALLLACCQGTRQIAYKWKREGIERTVTTEIDRHNPELRAIVLLAIDSAMRRGEILKLRWTDIDFDSRTVRIVGTHTKTQQERLTLLSKRAAEELRRLPSFGGRDKVFSVASFSRSWNTAKRLASIEGLTFHDLRRTSITRIVQCGIPIEIARKIAGHSPQDVTAKHYISVDVATLETVADRIDAYNERGGLLLPFAEKAEMDSETAFASSELIN